MYRQIITPQSSSFTIQFPKEMVGKEVEVIAFEIEAQVSVIEPLQEKLKTDLLAYFKRNPSPISDFKFDREEAKIFLDTNVLLYAHDSKDLRKQAIALDLINHADFITNAQVLTEYANVCLRKFKFSKIEVSNALANLVALEKVVATEPRHFILAEKLIKRYDFQFFDAIIVASAIANGCEILYSEDLQHKQVIEKSLTIINPFI
jgi:predicted nucleic acid-binding protein